MRQGANSDLEVAADADAQQLAAARPGRQQGALGGQPPAAAGAGVGRREQQGAAGAVGDAGPDVGRVAHRVEQRGDVLGPQAGHHQAGELAARPGDAAVQADAAPARRRAQAQQGRLRPGGGGAEVGAGGQVGADLARRAAGAHAAVGADQLDRPDADQHLVDQAQLGAVVGRPGRPAQHAVDDAAGQRQLRRQVLLDDLGLDGEPLALLAVDAAVFLELGVGDEAAQRQQHGAVDQPLVEEVTVLGLLRYAHGAALGRPPRRPATRGGGRRAASVGGGA
ncbi:hypothetical protein [Rugamonas sp. DEMB1]|uniref:hypothetical protein n=1 Tax=Rugamonas sp. DEMB1 TaxID=3039386 RepID=UPI00244C04F5|nr:hypothetical protein [Rugamonas sp. DEMB1]WGG50914.1 hypothetical protein QC826_00960 [Rugamonas sp. DEMB1]